MHTHNTTHKSYGQKGRENLSDANSTMTITKPTARSRLTNGSSLLSGVDGRSTWARRMRDLIELHTSDLGGVDACSNAERALVRRAACLSLECELLESQFATDGQSTPQSLDLYQRTSNSLRRLLESLGLERRQRDVTPDLRTYLAEKTQ